MTHILNLLTIRQAAYVMFAVKRLRELFGVKP